MESSSASSLDSVSRSLIPQAGAERHAESKTFEMTEFRFVANLKEPCFRINMLLGNPDKIAIINV